MKSISILFILFVLFIYFSCKKIENKTYNVSSVTLNCNDSNLIYGNTYKIYFSVIGTNTSELNILPKGNDFKKSNLTLINSGNTVSNSDNFFYFTPSKIGDVNVSVDILNPNTNNNVIFTANKTFNVVLANLNIIDISKFKNGTLLKNQTDTVNYIVLSSSPINQDINFTLNTVGNSISFLNNTNLFNKKINTITLSYDFIDNIKKLYSIDLKTILNPDNKPNFNYNLYTVCKISIPIFTSNSINLNGSQSTIIATAKTDFGANTTPIISVINVIDADFVVNATNPVGSFWTLQPNNNLNFVLSLSNYDVQNKINFSYKIETDDTSALEFIDNENNKIFYSQLNDLKTIPTRDINNNVLVNKWNGIVGEKDLNGVVFNTVDLKTNLKFKLLKEKNVSVVFSIISSAGKNIKSLPITIVAKTSLPNISTLLHTEKMGLSLSGFGGGSFADKFALNVVDANPYAKYDWKIVKNFVDNSSGTWTFFYNSKFVSDGNYTNESINNFNSELTFKTNTAGNSSNMLVGKYDVVYTFKRNYADDKGVVEYPFTKRLEIWDDRLDVEFTLYNQNFTALKSNHTMTAMEFDKYMFSFNITSETTKSNYKNYTIKIECEGDPIDIALTEFKTNVYENNVTTAYKTLVLGQEYAVGGQELGQVLNHIKVNPLSSQTKSIRTISKIKVTLKDTRIGVSKVYELGSLITN